MEYRTKSVDCLSGFFILVAISLSCGRHRGSRYSHFLGVHLKRKYEIHPRTHTWGGESGWEHIASPSLFKRLLCLVCPAELVCLMLALLALRCSARMMFCLERSWGGSLSAGLQERTGAVDVERGSRSPRLMNTSARNATDLVLDG